MTSSAARPHPQLSLPSPAPCCHPQWVATGGPSPSAHRQGDGARGRPRDRAKVTGLEQRPLPRESEEGPSWTVGVCAGGDLGQGGLRMVQGLRVCSAGGGPLRPATPPPGTFPGKGVEGLGPGGGSGAPTTLHPAVWVPWSLYQGPLWAVFWIFPRARPPQWALLLTPVSRLPDTGFSGKSGVSRP